MPVYFLFIFILHTSLGVVAVAGGALVFILGAVTERLTRKRLEAANQINAHAGSFTGAAMRNASIVRSMGMVGNISTRWQAQRRDHTPANLRQPCRRLWCMP